MCFGGLGGLRSPARPRHSLTHARTRSVGLNPTPLSVSVHLVLLSSSEFDFARRVQPASQLASVRPSLFSSSITDAAPAASCYNLQLRFGVPLPARSQPRPELARPGGRTLCRRSWRPSDSGGGGGGNRENMADDGYGQTGRYGAAAACTGRRWREPSATRS